jgi:hypothetical protein
MSTTTSASACNKLVCIREEDSFHKLMELSLYDAQNLIRDWMEHDRFNADPLLDEEDTPIPSRLVTEGDDDITLRRITDKSSLVDWGDETIGDTHIGKRKLKTISKKGKAKKSKRVLESDEEIPSSGQSPKYQESNDNTFATDTDNLGARGGGGGG